MDNSEKDKKDYLGKIVSYFPFFAVIALGYGIINQYVYYYFFNINILEYTELNELLLDTLNHLIVIIIPFIVLFSIALYIIIKSVDREYEKLSVEDKAKRIGESSIKKKPSKTYWVLGSMSVMFIICLFSLYIIDKRFSLLDNSYNISIMLSCLLFTLCTDYFPELYKRIFGRKIETSLYLILLSCLLLVGISITKGLYNASETKKNINNKIYVINDKDTIKSSKHYYFIGKTKGYFFFYNDTANTTDAYGIKDIKIFHLK